MMKLEVETDKIAQCLGCFNADKRVLDAAHEIAFYLSTKDNSFDQSRFLMIVENYPSCKIFGCAHYEKDSGICLWDGECVHNPLQHSS